MNFNLDRLPGFLKTSLLQMRRDRGLTVASILVMTLTLFILSVFRVVMIMSNSVLGYLESRPQVTAFFKSDFPEESVSSIAAQLRQRPEILSINFVSKDDAFKYYLGQHREEQSLLESVNRDIFPPSLEIKARKISDLSGIADNLGRREGIDEVVFFKDVANSLNRWLTAIRLVGLGLILSLIIISLFIVLITVGMAIRSRREEIEIMRLLGATTAYINLPFLTQGALYGLTAGALVGLTLLALTPFFAGHLEPVLRGLPSPSLFNLVALVSFGQLILGAGLGSFGAWLSAKRYL